MQKIKFVLSKMYILIPLLIVQAYSASADFMAPILRNMQDAFPDASLTLVQLTLTLPSAVAVPVQLCTVLLAQKMTKKHMLGTALGFICIGGLIPLAFHGNIMYVVISSFIIGIGQGIFIPTINALLSELADGNMRATVLGVKSCTTSILRSIMAIGVGFFGAIYWHKAYMMFVILIPFIALFLWITPNGEKAPPLVGKGIGFTGLKGVITPAFIIVTLLCSWASLCQTAFSTNIAGYIADKNLGGSITAGTATAFNTLAKTITGLAIGFLLRGMKRFTLPIGYAVAGLGYFIITRGDTLGVIQFGGVLFGIGMGIQMTGGLYYITETVDKKYLSQMMGLYFPCISLLISLSPVVINGLSKMIYGINNATNNFKVGIIGYLFDAVLMFLYQLFFCKNSMIGKVSGLEEEKKEEEPAAAEA